MERIIIRKRKMVPNNNKVVLPTPTKISRLKTKNVTTKIIIIITKTTMVMVLVTKRIIITIIITREQHWLSVKKCANQDKTAEEEEEEEPRTVAAREEQDEAKRWRQKRQSCSCGWWWPTSGRWRRSPICCARQRSRRSPTRRCGGARLYTTSECALAPASSPTAATLALSRSASPTSSLCLLTHEPHLSPLHLSFFFFLFVSNIASWFFPTTTKTKMSSHDELVAQLCAIAQIGPEKALSVLKVCLCYVYRYREREIEIEREEQQIILTSLCVVRAGERIQFGICCQHFSIDRFSSIVAFVYRRQSYIIAVSFCFLCVFYSDCVELFWWFDADKNSV
jgi:hypothetical protein